MLSLSSVGSCCFDSLAARSYSSAEIYRYLNWQRCKEKFVTWPQQKHHICSRYWPRLLTGSGSDRFSPGDQDQREQNCWQHRLWRTRQTRFRGSETVIRWDEANGASSAVTYSVAPNSAGGAWLVSWPLGKSCELRPRPFLPSDPADGCELWPPSTSKSPSVTLSEPEADGKLSGWHWSETRGGKPLHLIRTTMGFFKAGTGNTGIFGHWS